MHPEAFKTIFIRGKWLEWWLFSRKSITGVAIEPLDASDMDQLEAIDKDKFWVAEFFWKVIEVQF